MNLPRILMGLDLGQSQDFTALAVLKEIGKDGQNRPVWDVPILKRWPLLTSYLNIVKDVRETASKLEFEYLPLANPRQVELIVDATGVGAAVLDVFRAAKLPVKHLIGVKITAGMAVTNPAAGIWHVAKRELASAIQLVLQNRRLKVAKTLPEAATLARELQSFKIKITTAANETFEAWRERDHDDTVLAVAMAAWWGEREQKRVKMAFLPQGPDKPTISDDPLVQSMADESRLAGFRVEAGLPWKQW